ncbi:MAG: hypothetical protein KF693_06575 [Nitrospira sp.]|nr:hypothetical protein [Nitrospira sp.]
MMKYGAGIRKYLVQGLFVGVGVMAFVTGCTSGSSTKISEARNSGFMSLWNTYADCRSTSDLGQAVSDLKQLRSASEDGPVAYEGFVLPLPTRLERLVSDPASRVAVDVEAMVSACALHAGELALDQGNIDIARDFFVSVITLHKEENSYYVLKAKTLLGRIGQGINVSFNTR